MSTLSGVKFSVVLMTYNEESNLDRCLQSVQGIGDELFILDSFSTDGTAAIAKKYDARFETHVFGSYVEQKKRLIAKAKYDWVLCIDADEYLSDALRDSVREAMKQPQFDGYYNHRLNKLGDHWIRHGSWYPDRKIRLFDRRKVFIEGIDPHDVMAPQPGARIGYLKGDLMHHADENYSSRLYTIEKHSSRAAQALFDKGKRPGFFRMVIKPWGRFMSSFFLKRGFLDGYDGFFIAMSEAMYVWLREMKLFELRRMKKEGRSKSE